MNWCRKKFLKIYLKQRWNYFLAAIIAAIVVLLLAIGFIVDELSIWKADLGKYKCGWDRSDLVRETTDWKYISKCCDKLDDEDSKCCKTHTQHEIYLAFTLIGFFFIFAGPALIGVKKSYSPFPYFVSAFCLFVGVMAFSDGNPICYRGKYVRKGEIKLGATIIINLVSAFILIGCGCLGLFFGTGMCAKRAKEMTSGSKK